MSVFLDHTIGALKAYGAFHTSAEIGQQPELWVRCFEQIEQDQDAIRAFLNQAMAFKDLRIIVTGAGSSAFIGNAIAPILSKSISQVVMPIPTTDLVSHPHSYFKPEVPTLLISCARSGNSPESLAAVAFAQTLTKDVFHLVLTCNSEGKLAQKTKALPNALTLLMPSEANDQGFAMTSSLTTMLLSAYLTFHLDDLSLLKPLVLEERNHAIFNLGQNTDTINSLAKQDFHRAIFLGSEAFKALAEESALKLLELTGGKIDAMHNSSLGFRHGPKSAVHEKTLICLFLSGDAYARKYELDLLSELLSENIAQQIVVLATEGISPMVHPRLIWHQVKGTEGKSAFLFLQYILFAQQLAVALSIKHGFKPDDPCPSGMVNRVVKGVNIYPIQPIQ